MTTDERLDNHEQRIKGLEVAVSPIIPDPSPAPGPQTNWQLLWQIITSLFSGVSVSGIVGNIFKLAYPAVLILAMQWAGCIGPAPSPAPPGPTPTPTPTPIPPPQPPPVPPAPIDEPGNKVVMIYESSKLSDKEFPRARANVLFDMEVRQYLTAKCGKDWRMVDKDVNAAKDSPFVSKALKLPRTEDWWIVISDGKTGTSERLPDDLPKALALLKKYLP